MGRKKPDLGRPRRTARRVRFEPPLEGQPLKQQKKRPVKDRWFYETVKVSKAAVITQNGERNSRGEDEMSVEVGDEEKKAIFEESSQSTDTILDITDQSKCVFGNKKLLQQNFAISEENWDERRHFFTLQRENTG